VEHQPDGRACLPPGLIDRFPELGDIAGDDALCGAEQTPPLDDTSGPPDNVPVPTGRPHGPPGDIGEPQNQEQHPQPTPPTPQSDEHPTPPVELPEQSQ
jgi:hypothetical protein